MRYDKYHNAHKFSLEKVVTFVDKQYHIGNQRT